MVTMTVDDVIERARSRHWSFSEVQMPAGAVLQFIDDRQRSILLEAISGVGPLIGETRQIDTDQVDSAVVAVDGVGAPYFATSFEPGYALKFDGGVPYIDMTDFFIVDPFGVDGDSPGLPLPANLLQLGPVTAKLDDGREMPVQILNDAAAAALGGSTGLRALIAGARLVPIRALSLAGGTVADWWSHVIAVRLGIVLSPQVTALSDDITLPSPCVEYLIAAVTVFIAAASRNTKGEDKMFFQRQLAEAKQSMMDSVDSIVADVQENRIIYRR